MNENVSAVLIPLLTDASINNPGGDVLVVGPALNFMHRAISVQSFSDIYEMSGGTPSLTVELEWSVDRVNWTRAGTPVASLSAVGMAASTPYTSNQNFGPFVRFVVKFNSVTVPGHVNASIVLNVRFFG
ncbi:MAG: hypothetical protein FJ100_17090 [Deltaproteobacteria bacterium]|nr:hypothetical protein [Deltaproteobacteria bacterium]